MVHLIARERSDQLFLAGDVIASSLLDILAGDAIASLLFGILAGYVTTTILFYSFFGACTHVIFGRVNKTENGSRMAINIFTCYTKSSENTTLSHIQHTNEGLIYQHPAWFANENKTNLIYTC